MPPDWTPSTTTEGENNDDDDTSCESDGICMTNGANADPDDCSKYYLCTCDVNGEWIKTPQSCPDGLWFNPEFLYCDFPDNVECEQHVRLKNPQPFLSINDDKHKIVVEGNQATQVLPRIIYMSILIILIDQT